MRWAAPLADPVQAEPLVVNGEVLVATEGDTVAAYSEATGSRRWQTSLGRPVPGSDLPCGDISPSGVTGTPVADPGRGVLWVVAFVRPGRHLLFSLRLDTGQVVSRRVVDPPGASPLVEQQRGALALSGGLVNIPYGGLYGDCGDYHGYVVGAAEDGSGPLRSFRVPAAQQGGIWAPSGPAVDAAGNLYVASGNASPPRGNEVFRLSPGLAQTGSFAPADAVAMDRQDLDLGSTGPILLPGNLVFEVGKTGVGYLLRANHLGGSGGQLQATNVCTAAFGGDAAAGAMVYVPCVDGIVALRLVSPTNLAVAWRSEPFAAGSPVVAGSTVWALDPSGGRLLGFDAATGTAQARLAVGRSVRFGTPAVAAGQLYLVAGGRLLDVGS